MSKRDIAGTAREGDPAAHAFIRSIGTGTADLPPEQLALVLARTGNGANLQRIDRLMPLQEAMLYHHVKHETRDPYLMTGILRLSKRDLPRFYDALRFAIARHDALRSFFLWDGLDYSVRVTQRSALLSIEAMSAPVQRDPVAFLQAQLTPRRDLSIAPLIWVKSLHQEDEDTCLVAIEHHHLVSDAASWGLLLSELQTHMRGLAPQFPAPRYGDFVEQCRPQQDQRAQAFFTRMLGSLEEPSAPYGMRDIHADGATARLARLRLSDEVAAQLHAQARQSHCSVAALVHVAMARVVAATAACEDAVFGTVMSGRMNLVEDVDTMLGMLINTLPFRLDLGQLNVIDAVREADELLADMLDFEHTGISTAHACSAIPGGAPLFTTLLNYRRIPGRSGADLFLSAAGPRERSTFPLALGVEDYGDECWLECQAALPLDPLVQLGYLERALAQLARALHAGGKRPAMHIEVLSEQQLEAQLAGAGNARPHSALPPLTAHLRRQVLEGGDRLAIQASDHCWTYRQLEEASHRIARYLQRRGLGRGSTVAICIDRSATQLALLIGVMKAGAAYLPLDPGNPGPRQQSILDDARPCLFISTRSQAQQLDLAHVPMLDLAEAQAAWSSESPDPCGADPAPDQPAYIIYTSGSTGMPKGVIVEHRSLSNFLASMAIEPGMAAEDTLLSVTPLSFDIAALELYLPLIVGARLVLPPVETVRDPFRLAALIASERITLMQATPATWRMLIGDGWRGQPGLRLLCGGEALPPGLADELLSRGESLWNLYGPTETTIWSMAKRITSCADISLGHPIANTGVYVLDAHMRALPPGAIGELFIGGEGVARGYLNRPELTAQRFLRAPFSAAGERIYRTGDLARRRPDGEIDYMGRADDQVKLRGFRIELGEIAAHLGACDTVQHATVLLSSDGEPCLVAYVNLHPGIDDRVATLDHLAAHLADCLPAYMLPGRYICVSDWPLTPNGKTDTRSLRALDVCAPAAPDAFLAPDQLTMLALFRVTLGHAALDSIGNFFRHGGNSISAVLLRSRVNASFGCQLKLADIYDHPTPVDLLRQVGKAQRLVAITPTTEGEQGAKVLMAPATTKQRTDWMFNQISLLCDMGSLGVPVAVSLPRLSAACIAEAFVHTINCFDNLRTTIAPHEGALVQQIHPAAQANSWLQFRELDMTSDPAPQLALLQDELMQCQFDFAKLPLLRATAVTHRDGVTVLVIFDHVVGDQHFFNAFGACLTQSANCLLLEEALAIPSAASSILEYAQWEMAELSGEPAVAHQRYWLDLVDGYHFSCISNFFADYPREHLPGYQADIDECLAHLPAQLPDYFREHYSGSVLKGLSAPEASARYTQPLDGRTLQRLRGVCAGSSVLLSTVAITAVQLALHRLTGCDQVLFGLLVESRDLDRHQGISGCFLNEMLFLGIAQSHFSYHDYFLKTQDQLMSSDEHKVYPLARLLQEMDRSLDSLGPIFVNFSSGGADTALGQVALGHSEGGFCTGDLDLVISPRRDGIYLDCQYKTSRFKRSTVERIVHLLTETLMSMCDNVNAKPCV